MTIKFREFVNLCLTPKQADVMLADIKKELDREDDDEYRKMVLNNIKCKLERGIR